MLFCEKEDCKYRSKRKSSKYTTKAGTPLYKCKAKNTLVSFYADGCDDVFIPAKNTCTCLTYREVGE